MIRIAIDGPSGAGKSSVAKAIAEKLGILYLDTGSLYRTVGFYILRCGIDPKNEQEVAAQISQVRLDLLFRDGRQVMLLDGEDITDKIRTQEISMAASDVSKIPAVRAFLLDMQKDLAAKNSVIMDGRDIGTVIIPDAEVKIFLTAKPEARAMRRYEEQKARGLQVSYEEVLAQMIERDAQDATRAIAPCVCAEDAIEIDNSDMDPQQTVRAIMKIVKKVQKQKKKRGSKFYMFFWHLLAPMVRLVFRVHIHGKENLPKEGGYLICSNHIGIRDVLVIAAVFPRQVRFIAKKEWFSVPILAPLIRALGAISLDRSGNDVDALKSSVHIAKEGYPVVIFPQGHRFPAVDPATTPIKNGAGLIAYRAKTPVLPVCLKAKGYRYGFLTRLDLYVGEMIPFEQFGFQKGGYKEYKAATEKIFSEICRLPNAAPAAPDESNPQ